ncbi:class II aldolase/adducin family protein [Psychrosphaera sp. B3R10]|uniref:class II aldolase/adducin family protein n=1 Tax=unclassified Psychrosphaera TaxID=2641570 RepID=UPI001C084FEB|nr:MULTISPECIES: class II aldolase/adducin family protein [unclassified Psychrosphaera]MBU2880861.1 class II aldolase/adducin family protein [Psychrosphaera sp. I2R16]MBU2990920.1 class II aldolase/adducin family protein [Psychrosphaera sp. B3R10]MDO6720719.1 class II aldolase/adducin family protein [Psychrosphaera sp. 1_MG-2023]
MYELPPISLKGQVSEQEWQTRVELAAAYRLYVIHGWDDLIHTHISARIPGTEHLLINAFGLAFDEINASNLVKIDIDGNVIQQDCPFSINPAGYTIHGAVHEARHEDQCVLHVHTNETIAVASMKDGLLPISQYSMFALASMSYHDYEGLAVNQDEKKRLQDDLGAANFMLLRNHGALTLGKTIGDAFMHMYDLVRACHIQVQALSMQQPINYVEQSIIDGIKAQANIVHSGQTGGEKAWPAMMRKVKRTYPEFDQ